MAEKLTTKNCIITCQNRRVYDSPAHIPSISSCNIPCSINVRIERMSTILTLKESRMSSSISTRTPIAFFGCISRINIDNPYSLFQSLIFNKVLELPKSPLVNPFVVPSRLSDSSQIFHNNNISHFQRGNNRFAYLVVSPTHKPIPFSRELFEFSLGSFCAFGLKFTNKPISPLSQGFNFITIKNIVGSDGEFINSQVHPKNFTMLVRSCGAFSGECKSKIMFIFRLSKKAFNNLPIFKIFQSIIRNRDRNLNSTFESRNTQNIIFKRETSWSIIPNRSPIDKGFTFSFLDNSTSLFNAGDRELRGQTYAPQIIINKRMEFDIVPNSQFPSFINTELKPLLIEFDSLQDNLTNIQLNRNTSYQHCRNLSNSYYLNVSEGLNSAIPPTNKFVGLLASNTIL